MTDKERDRIECAIRHIQTAVDVDPWAAEIAVAAMKELFGNSEQLDAISRAATIDALNNVLADYIPCLIGRNEGIPLKCAVAIRDLPSAQPDIIACGDCKHWICHDRRCGYWNHGVKPLDWCCHAERRSDG